MYNGLFYATVRADQLIEAAMKGRINPTLLFGSSGDDGLIIQTEIENLRKSVDGSLVITKFYPYDKKRCAEAGIDNPLKYLIQRCAEANIHFTLYSYTPVKLKDGYYVECTYAEKDLPLILEEMAKPEWSIAEEV